MSNVHTSSSSRSGSTSRLPLLLRRGFIFLVFLLRPFDPARAQGGTGAITGRVTSARDGAALSRARVTIDGGNREALTAEDGSFRFLGVPEGSVRLTVSYLGLASQTVDLRVTSGGVATREIQLERAVVGTNKMEVVQLGAFTVVTDREEGAQAMALNDQRHSPNLKSVVAADEFGDRKGSIGHFMSFLPGVSLDFAGANPTNASLRGFPATFTGISVDGAHMSSTFAEGRGQRLEEVSSLNISRVEVTKVPTPDQPASGLGGSINLVSRSGFESRRRKFSYDVYGMYHSWQGLTLDGGPKGDVAAVSPKYNQPSVEMTLVQPWRDNVSLTLGYSRYWEHKPMESGTKQTDEQPTWDLINLVQRQSQWNSLNQVRIRTSVQAGADWRITPSDTLTFRFWHQEPLLATNRSVLGLNYGAGATGGPTFTQGAAAAVGIATMNGSGNNIYNRTKNRITNLKYRHEGAVWRIEAAFSYTDSLTDKRDTERGHFNTTPAQIANLIIRGDGIPASGGTIPTVYTATTRTGAAVDLYDGRNYAISTVTSNPADTTMRRKNGRLDVSRGFAVGIPLTLKSGVAVDTSDRDNRSPNLTWDFRPNGATDVTARLAGNFDVFDEAFNAGGPTIFGRRVQWFSNRKLYDLYLQRPAWFVPNLPLAHQNYVNNSREMTETISAAYLRGDLRLLDNRLGIVTGVRFERTEVKGSGPINDINATFRRDAAGNFILNNGQRVLITTDALEQAKLRYLERAARATQDYQGFYPSVNTTYTFTERLLLRGAYAQTVGRPQTTTVTPGSTITAPDVANPTITVSNVGLKPWTAQSYDLSLESYQIKNGVGSVGVFHKSIGGFFSNIRTAATPAALAQYGLANDPVFQGYEIATVTNGGDATVKGMEFSYRQSLTFLPNWARGLQAFGNMTRLQVDGSNSADFSGFNPRTYAAGVSLIRPRFFVKCTYNFQGEIRTGAAAVNVANGIPANTSNYQGAKRRLGVDAQYSLSKRFSAYVAIVDLLGFEQVVRRYAPNTPDYAKPSRLQELGYFTTVGVRGEF